MRRGAEHQYCLKRLSDPDMHENTVCGGENMLLEEAIAPDSVLCFQSLALGLAQSEHSTNTYEQMGRQSARGRTPA